ncbi:MAG: toprim domain-containing protein [Chloroflexota bacterium]
MQANQAKQIHLEALLGRLGHHPVKERKGELWYLSPFREETEASFKLSKDGKAWFDHGAGQGGNILDFVMLYDQTGVRGALRRIEGLMAQPVRDVQRDVAPKPFDIDSSLAEKSSGEGSDLQITRIQPLQNRGLIEYLRKRGVEVEITRPWVQEVHYERGGKPYFALGFGNDAGGYELRTLNFKGTTGAKEITTIAGIGQGDSSSVAVFEGFTDFLSAIVLTGHPPTMGCIVLNSVSMKDRAIQKIREMGVEQLHLYLDRDEAGLAMVQYFREHLPDVTVYDESMLYDGSKDLNDYLVAKQQSAGHAR